MIVEYTAESHIYEPARATDGSAAYDLYCTEDTQILPYRSRLVCTGIKVQLPPGHALLILPRSGFSFKNQIVMPNSLGLIDSDYRGFMGITMMWMPDPVETLEVFRRESPAGHITHELRHRKDAVFMVLKNTRIAQAMLIECKEIDWRKVDGLSATVRGDGGLGSTGLRAPDAVASSGGKDRAG